MACEFHTFPQSKQPVDQLDYELDARYYLTGDSIVSASFVLTGGIVLIDHDILSDAKRVNFRLGGGVINTIATISITLTLLSGQVKKLDAKLQVC